MPNRERRGPRSSEPSCSWLVGCGFDSVAVAEHLCIGLVAVNGPASDMTQGRGERQRDHEGTLQSESKKNLPLHRVGAKQEVVTVTVAAEDAVIRSKYVFCARPCAFELLIETSFCSRRPLRKCTIR